jgi:hypothetical protein
MAAAKGADPSIFAFMSRKPDGMTANVLPFEHLMTIAQSIDSLLAWSATSTSVVSRIWQFDSRDGIEELQQRRALNYYVVLITVLTQ